MEELVNVPWLGFCDLDSHLHAPLRRKTQNRPITPLIFIGGGGAFLSEKFRLGDKDQLYQPIFSDLRA